MDNLGEQQMRLLEIICKVYFSLSETESTCTFIALYWLPVKTEIDIHNWDNNVPEITDLLDYLHILYAMTIFVSPLQISGDI